ncbi:cytoglobin-2-like [Clavelina lepadiformis]|uniref:cytoglobin-2-like n=1 Tax=Clavelina lepadiformis TaxID=159417 RepID=UPI00404279FF
MQGITMKLALFFCALTTVYRITDGINCFVCEDEVNTQQCLNSGELKSCEPGEVCLNEVRRKGDGIRITKRCKQPTACQNNYLQNDNGVVHQCNARNPNFVCRCCCQTDECNAASLPCVGGYPDDSISEPQRSEQLFSDDEVNTLRYSWNDLVPFGLDTVGLLILRRLFNDYPQTRQLFPSLDIPQDELLSLEQLSENPLVVLHAERVANAVDNIIAILEEPEILVEFLTWLGERHAAYGVEPINFEYMGHVILNTIQDTFELQDDSEILSAWAKAYGAIRQVIVDTIRSSIKEESYEPAE